MNVSMFVGTSQSQASSVLSKSQHDQQAYERMLQALQQFINEDRLSSTAYTNAKGFYSAVLTPLAKAGILLSEAVGEACQKFVQDYQSTVDSGDLKSDELEEKIRQLDMRISQLDSIRATIEGKDLADNFKIRQLNQNSQAKTLLEDSKKVLQEKLDKLLEFHGTSPDIFSAISELESIVNQGAAQAGSSFTGSGFSIPTDLGWTSSVAEKWQTRTDNIKKKEKEFHEKNIKELEKHNVYAWPYEDPETKEIKIMWFIDKDGVRVFDKELQDYVERYGKNLEGIYEVVGWDKIYELDLAARRRGDGKNYLNSNQLENWKTYSQVGAHVESAYWMANKTGLLDLALMAGLAYVNKKTKVSTSSNVANVLDDAADAKKVSGANVGKNLQNQSKNIRDSLDDFIINYKKSDEYLNLSNSQKKIVNRKLDRLGKGNVATAKVDIPELKTDFKAHSQLHSKDSLGNMDDFSVTPTEKDRIFKNYVEDDYLRYNDTEAKILEDIASQLKDPNIKGEINLFSELDCCQSCSNLILEFRKKYPNIKINITTNNTLK